MAIKRNSHRGQRGRAVCCHLLQLVNDVLMPQVYSVKVSYYRCLWLHPRISAGVMNSLDTHRDGTNAVGQAVINKEDVICRYACLFDNLFINPSVRLYYSEVT